VIIHLSLHSTPVTVNETAFKLVTKEEYFKNSRVLSKYFGIKISNLVTLLFVSAIADVCPDLYIEVHKKII
jgi:hypothetical protein